MIAAGERSVPKTGSARALLGIAAAIRATVPALRFLHADVVGLAVKFLQGAVLPRGYCPAFAWG